MKIAAIAVTALVAVVTLSGCNLNGSALLGNDPAEKTEPIVSTWSVCQDKAVKLVASTEDGGCSSPTRIEDYLVDVDTYTDSKKLILSFQPISNTSYPKINSIDFTQSEYSAAGKYIEKVKTGSCKLISEPNSDRHKYECIVKSTGSSKLFLHRLELQNESCNAIAVYEAQYPHSSCSIQSYPYLDTVYIGSSSVDGIYASN